MNYDPNLKVNVTLTHASLSMIVQGLTAINNANAVLVDELNQAFFKALSESQAVAPSPITQDNNHGNQETN